MSLKKHILTHPKRRLWLFSGLDGDFRVKSIWWISLIVLALLLTTLMSGCKSDSSSNKRQSQNIHEAAEAGDKAAVGRFLAEGVSPNAAGVMGLTPLHTAARRGHGEVVRFLLAQGADVEVKDKNRMTALHWAAAYGSLDTVKVLVAKGANVNAKNKHGGTPLGAATMGRGECEEVTVFLLTKGAYLSVQHSDGSTLLHKAVLNGQPGVLRILLENGADATIKDKDRKTALERARVISQTKFRSGSPLAKRKAQFEMCVQILEEYRKN